MRRLILFAAMALLACGATSVQAQPAEPVGPFAVDARGLMAGLPTIEGWVPALPAGSIVASRGYGFDLGAHVYPRSGTLAPQISFNFGHRDGWSHISFGYGLGKVSSEASGGGLTPTTVDQGWGGAINFGGGARWFITRHLGVGFDARWHKLGSREATATSPAAIRTTLFQLGVGVTIH